MRPRRRSPAPARFAPILGLVAACLGSLAVARSSARAQEASFPEPSGHVVDAAGLLEPSVRDALEALCREVKQKTEAEIAVALVPSIAPLDVDTYAVELYEHWGVGRRGENDGVLFVVARDERRVRIEVGYGLEPILPDGRAGGILRARVVPHLRQNDWNQGVAGGTMALAAVIAEEHGVTLEGLAPGFEAEPRDFGERRRGSGLGAVMTGLFVIMLLSGLGGGRGGRRRRRGLWPLIFLGGARGGFGGGSFGGGGFGGFGGGMSGGGGASSGF